MSTTAFTRRLFETAQSNLDKTGLFATRDIERGELVAAEPSNTQRDDRKASSLPWEGCGNLFYLNHACTPNAEVAWNSTSQTYDLHAICDIEDGDELTIAYVNVYRMRTQRWRKLGFSCNCNDCRPGSGQLDRAEKERVSIGVGIAKLKAFRTKHFASLDDDDPMKLTGTSTTSLNYDRQLLDIVGLALDVLKTAEKAGFWDSGLSLAYDIVATCTGAVSTTTDEETNVARSDRYRAAQLVCLRQCLGDAHPRTEKCELYAKETVGHDLEMMVAAALRAQKNVAAEAQGATRDTMPERSPASVPPADSEVTESSGGRRDEQSGRDITDNDRDAVEGRHSSTYPDQHAPATFDDGISEDTGGSNDSDDSGSSGKGGRDSPDPRPFYAHIAPWTLCKSVVHGQGIRAARPIAECELIASVPASFIVDGGLLRDRCVFHDTFGGLKDDLQKDMLQLITRSPSAYVRPIGTVTQLHEAIEDDAEGVSDHLLSRLHISCHPFIPGQGRLPMVL